jgi:hypothetical protein
MFEALRWRKTQHDAEVALQHAVHSLAQVGRTPLVIGSIAAMAVIGMVTGMGLNHKARGRSRAKVLAARNGGNGVRRKTRKMKTPAH